MSDEPKGSASAGHELNSAEKAGLDKVEPRVETARLDGRPTGNERPLGFDPAKPGEDAAKAAKATDRATAPAPAKAAAPAAAQARPHDPRTMGFVGTVEHTAAMERAEADRNTEYKVIQAPRPAVESTMVQATPQAVYEELDANAGKVPSQAQVIAAVARKQ